MALAERVAAGNRMANRRPAVASPAAAMPGGGVRRALGRPEPSATYVVRIVGQRRIRAPLAATTAREARRPPRLRRPSVVAIQRRAAARAARGALRGQQENNGASSTRGVVSRDRSASIAQAHSVGTPTKMAVCALSPPGKRSTRVSKPDSSATATRSCSIIRCACRQSKLREPSPSMADDRSAMLSSAAASSAKSPGARRDWSHSERGYQRSVGLAEPMAAGRRPLPPSAGACCSAFQRQHGERTKGTRLSIAARTARSATEPQARSPMTTSPSCRSASRSAASCCAVATSTPACAARCCSAVTASCSMSTPRPLQPRTATIGKSRSPSPAHASTKRRLPCWAMMLWHT
mmetsp:Transcript_13351/g.46431  ORF Transcript_13351/g.46431 Transcript_13351/m.46431 type:complete len:350 (-) Transcript_13351:361-1410(-)